MAFLFPISHQSKPANFEIFVLNMCTFGKRQRLAEIKIRFTFHLQAQLSRVGYNLRAEVVKTVCAKLVVYR